MTWFARGVAAVAVALAVAALVGGQFLLASSTTAIAMGALSGSVATRRREAERQAAFAQRLRVARREPQGVLVVRRQPAWFPARLVPVWVDVDGEARGRLDAPGQGSFAVPAGIRTVTFRRPWAMGRSTSVQVPVDGTAALEV